jgi:hypothetical protein
MSASGTTSLAVSAAITAAGDVQVITPPAGRGITFTLVATGTVGVSSDVAVAVTAPVVVTGRLTGGAASIPVGVTVTASGTVSATSGVTLVITADLRLDGVVRGLTLYHGPKITVGAPHDSPASVGHPVRRLATVGAARGARTVGAPNDSNRG